MPDTGPPLMQVLVLAERLGVSPGIARSMLGPEDPPRAARVPVPREEARPDDGQVADTSPIRPSRKASTNSA